VTSETQFKRTTGTRNYSKYYVLQSHADEDDDDLIDETVTQCRPGYTGDNILLSDNVFSLIVCVCFTVEYRSVDF